MTEVGRYDINLGGHTLRLVRGADGALALSFTDAPDEPGVRGRLGSILFNDLHHGLGANLTLEGDRYTFSDLDASRPGRIEHPGQGKVAVTGPGGSTDPGPVETKRVFASTIQWESDCWFVLPAASGAAQSKVVKIAGGGVTWTEPSVSFLAAGQVIRGPGAFYDGLWFFGLENQAGQSIGHVVFDPTADTWTARSGASDTKMSLFFSAHTFLWGLEVQSVGNKGAIGWRLRVTDATGAGASADSNWRNLTVTIRQSYPTAIYPFGEWMLVFGVDGQILAISETPPNRALLPPGALAGSEEFGVGVIQWGGSLVFPSGGGGVHSIDLSSLELTDIAPENTQGALPQGRRLRVSTITPYGPDLLVGTRSESNNQVSVLKLRRYPEGIAYNELQIISAITGDHSVRSIAALPSGKIYLLIGNATESRIRRLVISPVGGGRPLAFDSAVVRALETASSFGDTPGRKLFLQARGWLESALVGANNEARIRIGVDGGPLALAGVVTQAGPFVLTGARPVGRAVRLSVEINFATDNGTDWPVLLLPLFVDYVEEPTSGARITLDVESGGGFRRSGSAQRAREQLWSTLQALVGSQQTLQLLESNTVYNVIVEQVEMVDSKGPTGRERPIAAIRVTLRVI